MSLSNYKNTLISLFVIVWLSLFTYETVRYSFLNKIPHMKFPKIKFLFPPAGWIMFYHYSDSEVMAEVYGVKGDKLELIDPHLIFNNHWIGYDNIHRNILIEVLDPRKAKSFCRYLRRKFPQYEHFKIVEVIYPSVSKQPGKKIRKIAYEC